MEYVQAAINNVATAATQIQQKKAGVGRRSGAISKSEAYEPPASAPLPPTTSQQSPEQATATRTTATAIAQAAHHLNQQRENWLNPPSWVDWVQTPEEEQAGYPKRPIAKPGFEAELKNRTLTHLYNARPTWLTLAHQALDKAVATAYGWTDYTPATPDDDILRQLLALNLERSQPEIKGK